MQVKRGGRGGGRRATGKFPAGGIRCLGRTAWSTHLGSVLQASGIRISVGGARRLHGNSLLVTVTDARYKVTTGDVVARTYTAGPPGTELGPVSHTPAVWPL